MRFQSIFLRLFVLLFTLSALSLAAPTRAEACEPYVPTAGFWATGDQYKPTIPVDGSWITVGNYGVYREDAEIYAEFGVKDEDDAWVEGDAVVELYGELSSLGEGYAHPMFVIWTPKEPLEPNQKYTLYSSTSDRDYGWSWVEEFYTSDAHQNSDVLDGATIATVDAEYVDLPARNNRCRESKPCPTSCGCMTRYWSTRYFREAWIDIGIQWPDVDNHEPFYVVVEDGAGTVLNMIPSTETEAKISQRFEHAQEPPFELVLKSYRVGEDTPFATDTYTVTETDLPWPEETTFRAESRPRSCSRRSSTSVHNDGFLAPDAGGCSSAPSHTPSLPTLLWVSALIVTLRLRRRGDGIQHMPNM